ncbi:MAG TPA: hypothetical protein DD400_05925, partial [Rhodospirillaceae bacterium]|nr:hypothetical protein [Rhodospirillaceae bacterium]
MFFLSNQKKAFTCLFLVGIRHLEAFLYKTSLWALVFFFIYCMRFEKNYFRSSFMSEVPFESSLVFLKARSAEESTSCSCWMAYAPTGVKSMDLNERTSLRAMVS